MAAPEERRGEPLGIALGAAVVGAVAQATSDFVPYALLGLACLAMLARVSGQIAGKGRTAMTASEHRTLPLRDYDHLPIASLRQRIRSLTDQEIRRLLSYEEKHANRPVAVQAMRTRLVELASGQSPTDGSQQIGSDWPESPSGGGLVNRATVAPPVSPPPHGNPAQPGKPKADKQVP